MAEQIQDVDLVKADLLRQQEMEAERAPMEGMLRDIERYFDPAQAGGFSPSATPTTENYNVDVTGMTALGRFDAALGYVTTPKNSRWHGLTVVDRELARLPATQRWCEHATDRLFDCRYAAHTGAGTAYSGDRRQLGTYGNGPLWVDEWKGRGLFYRSLHFSEIWIDVDFRGRIDTVHRKFELTARQAREQFGDDNLPPKIRTALEQEKTCGDKFVFLHVIRPNEDYQRERFDWRGKPIVSRYIAVDEKWIVSKGGYYTMPIPVSRNTVSPGRKYGNSPAMIVIGAQRGLEQIARTLLRAAHKAVDPPIAFYDDGDITKFATKPGGLNPGMVDSEGRPLFAIMQQGGSFPIGRDIQEGERGIVRTEFLEEFFKILSDPSDRMTATQVLEMAAKQGVLIQPFADAYETEKLGVMVERELDILMRAGQIDEMPPEMTEAGAKPLTVMTNPLARMARAQEASAFTRWVEIGVQAASAGRPDALDRIDFDKGMATVGEVLGVRPSMILSDDELAELRQARAAKEEAATAAQVIPDAAGAALDLARANQVQQQLAVGGGM